MIATLVIAFMHSAIAGCAMDGPDSPQFVGLGQAMNEALAVSPEGQFVLGNKSEIGAVMWSAQAGTQPMPLLPGATSSDASYGVSDEGRFAIGRQTIDGKSTAVVWDRLGGIVTVLSNLPGLPGPTTAADISLLGNVVVGGADSWVPLMWIDGMTALLHPTLNAGSLGVSADGNIIVGQGLLPPSNKLKRAFIRHSQGTIQFLGTLGSGCCSQGSSAKAVAMGCELVVVGGTETSDPGVNYTAFRWTASDQKMVALGTLPLAIESTATDVSHNGQVIVGYCCNFSTDQRRAFLWTPELYMVSLKDHLLSLGLNEVEDWTLYEAWSVSSDGTRIVGRGRNKLKDVDEGFLVILPSSRVCFADCDGCGGLSVSDFICFQTLFAVGDPDADCDESGTLSIDDFICFQTLFAVGC